MNQLIEIAHTSHFSVKFSRIDMLLSYFCNDLIVVNAIVECLPQSLKEQSHIYMILMKNHNYLSVFISSTFIY